MKTLNKFESDHRPKFQMPEMPRPLSEHDWLQQFVGEWQSEAECHVEPGSPPVKSVGHERIRALGGFWTVSEIEAEISGRPFRTIQILGFDPHKERFIGTWVDTMTSYMWRYEGTLNESKNVLTLETEGPCPMHSGISKFRETLEARDHDHKVYTSSIIDENGQWSTNLIANAHRIYP